MKIHDITGSKSCLDAAFINVQIGMEFIGSCFNCLVNGKLFVIGFEEVNCLDKDLDLNIFGNGWSFS